MENKQFVIKEKHLLWTIIILLFGYMLIGYIAFFSFEDSKQCLANPFTYGAEKIATENTGDLFCSCSFQNLEYAPFGFDKEEVAVRLGPSFR